MGGDRSPATTARLSGRRDPSLVQTGFGPPDEDEAVDYAKFTSGPVPLA